MAGVQIDGVNNKIDFDDDQDTSISANTDDTLVIEAGGNTLATFTATTLTINDGTTITTADNTAQLTLKSTDADANVGPDFVLQRDSGSPADGDALGRIKFTADNDAGEALDHISINTAIVDASDGTEDASITFNVLTAGSVVDRFNIGSAEVVVNEGSIDSDFRVESNGNTAMLHVDAGNDRVGIGTASPATQLHLANTGGIELRLDADTNNSGQEDSFIKFTTDGGGQIGIVGMDNNNSSTLFTGNTENAMVLGCVSNLPVVFATNDTERMQIHSGGDISIGRATVDTTNAGISLEAGGTGVFVRSGGPCVIANRLADDGEIIRIVQAGTTEGTISTSGSTVSYNAFTGSHWSRLADNSKPTILRGTIMESLDSMVNWYKAVADVTEEKYTAEDQAVIDGEKNVGDVKTKAHTAKEEIALPDGKSVGDAVTFTHKGTEYTGVYVKENDVKHVHSKVSDLADSTRVYGVFHCWGYDNAAGVNDMEIAQVGTYIIRVHKDVTVAAGDLLVSNGDGTAKKQDDDIIRSKTVAKVNSNIKVETYSDGSYTVPCTLHC